MVYRRSDPEFAQKLFWLSQAGGSHGGHFSRHALFYAFAEEADLPPAKAPTLASRRLEGFGAVLRHNVHRADETYCLLMLGPGGYRYHRTEGSILLIENGKPLIFDGGEAGETWRHTTLSFGETHRPLAAGHVERFVSTERCDFVQGVNPKALQPGEPVFLSDSCEHHLVKLAVERFNEPYPANSRSLLHVKGDYYILHDQLHLPDGQLTHWHLQAVADEHTGDWRHGYHFKGRFGTDLQVLLPGQDFDAAQVRQDPILEYAKKPEECFAMRHLQLSATAPRQILAVIRPLHHGKEPLQAELRATATGGCILTVTGPGIDDWHCFDRNGVAIDVKGLRFKGRYGSVIRRGARSFPVVYDGETL